MSFRPINNNNLQIYPKIQIDRGSVIKPCVTDQAAADQFLDGTDSSWKRIIHDAWHEGFPFILRCISNIQVPTNANTYYTYLIRAIKYVALLMLHIHRVYLYIYGYFYPYSLMSLDEVCNEFSRCPKWTESVVRAFAWHPNYDRCAVAICNDYIHVYHEATRIRVLRHNQQRKIVDMKWHPAEKDVLVVATQTNIILWRVVDTYTGPSGLRDNMGASTFTCLIPGVHLIRRENESQSYLSPRSDHTNGSSTDSHVPTSQTSAQNFMLLENVLPAPIVSIEFDGMGEKLYASSPNSSKLAILSVNKLLNSDPHTNLFKRDESIKYIRKFGQGVTQIRWAPGKDRLATATTSSYFRVFEPFSWTCNRWPTQGGVIQDMVWSRPQGRILLIANKNEPFLYALPFLDSSQSRDVGGNKSLMKALDLTATRSELGDMVGGRVQAFAWDKAGKRLAISFKDNPESILLYRTAEKPTVEFHQMGIIQSDNGSHPLLMEFHDKFRNGSLLTICWSDGNCQHIPLTFTNHEQARNGLSKVNGINNSFDLSSNNLNGISSPSKTPRSMTNFCHVSGNNSISSNSSTLMPINKVSHQTTLFSLSKRSPLSENSIANSSSDSHNT